MDSFFAKLSRDPRRGEVFWWLYDAYDGIMQRTRGRRMSWHVLLNELQENGLTNSEGNPVTNVNSLRRTFERVRALKKRDAEWLARQEAERSQVGGNDQPDRLSSPAFAFATMPWKYPPAVVRKCAGSLVETMAIAIAACSRPMARQASPHSDFDTSRSDRRKAAASMISGQVGIGCSR